MKTRWKIAIGVFSVVILAIAVKRCMASSDSNQQESQNFTTELQFQDAAGWQGYKFNGDLLIQQWTPHETKGSTYFYYKFTDRSGVTWTIPAEKCLVKRYPKTEPQTSPPPPTTTQKSQDKKLW